MSHTYDAQGNRTGTTAQGGTTRYTFDELNRRIAVTAVGGPITTTFDRTNLPTAVTYPNGVTTTSTYDAAMRVKTIQTAKAGTPLESYAYVYDKNGNRTLQTKTVGTATETTSYLYDDDDWLKQTAMNRIDGATTAGQTVNYTLDAVGNRTVENSSGTGSLATTGSYTKTYTLDARDRVTQIVATGPAAGTTTYGYDANGNLISRGQGGATRTYTWNARDRLVEVKNGSTSIGQYKYNAEGLRDEIAGERRTTWVNGFAYLDKTPANGFLAKYETQANGRSPVAAITAGGAEYVHIDALGSSTLETNASGTTTAVTTYDAFGNSITAGATANKFGYTGHETDNATGLIYFKARHYDPELGRFISADAFEGEPNIPVSWNAYLYSNGNPLIFVDLTGNAAELPEIDQQQRVVGGVTRSVSLGMRETFNPNNSLLERSINATLALLALPVATVESVLYAPLNVAPAARETGQHIARAQLQTDPDARNVDILRAVSTGSEAFASQGAWLAGPRPQRAPLDRTTAKTASEVSILTEREAQAVTGGSPTRVRSNAKDTTPVEIGESHSGPGVKGQVDNSGRTAVPEPAAVEPPVVGYKREGTRRETQTELELKIEHPKGSVQREQYLRDAEGNIVKDSRTNTGRRIDYVVIEDGVAIRKVETTSLGADKTAQVAKEQRIIESGGKYVRDRETGSLVPIDQVKIKTEIIRRN